MKITDTAFKDVKIIEYFYSFDIRGSFIKLYNETEFEKHGLCTHFSEEYYSVSHKDTIRRMHFQTPPYQHAKLIHVIRGSVVDVIIDLRKDSPDYKKFIAIQLSGNKPKSIYIPEGFAHGFKCLEDNTIMIYNTSTVYNSESDSGILYESIGYDWNVDDPILSERDKTFCTLEEFDSPF